LATKAKVATLFLALPAVAVRMGALLLLSHHLGLREGLGVLLDQIVLVGALVAAFFLAASWTTKLYGYLLTLIGGTAALALATHVRGMAGFWLATHGLGWIEPALVTLRLDGMALTVFAVGVAVCAVLQARYRRLWPVAIALAATLALTVGLQEFLRADAKAAGPANGMEINFGGTISEYVLKDGQMIYDPLGGHAIVPATATGVSLASDRRQPFAVISSKEDVSFTVTSSKQDGIVDSREIQLTYNLDLPANEYVWPVVIDTTVQTRSGRRLKQSATDYSEMNDGSNPLETAFRRLVLHDSPATTRLVSVFAAPADESEFHDDPLIHLEGTVVWCRWRYHLVAPRPLQLGGTTIVGNHRLRLDRLIRNSNDVRAGWLYDAVTPELVGARSNSDSDLVRVVFVRDGRSWPEDGGTWSTFAMGGYEYSGANFNFDQPESDEKISAISASLNPPGITTKDAPVELSYFNHGSTAELPPSVAPGLYVFYADEVGRFKQPFSIDAPSGD
jgi:hypothetical protein